MLAAADVLPAQVEGQGAELAHLPHHGRAEQSGEWCWLLGLGSPVGEEEPLHQHHLRPGQQLPRPALLQLPHAVAGRGADVGRQGAVIPLQVALVSNG